MDFSGLFSLQIELFLLMGIGYILRKKEVMTAAGKSSLTDMIIDIIIPCNIISSFRIEMSSEILNSCMQVLIVSIFIQLFCSILARTLYNKFAHERKVVLQYATIVSNGGFLGNPIAEGLYGSIGLLYASIYLIPQRIVMWSAGVSMFTVSPSRKEVIKKVLKHPCIIAVEIGFVLMFTQMPLPTFLSKTITAVGSCTTSLTMMMIGAILAEAGLRGMISKISLEYTFLRLIAIPAVVMVGCRIFNIEALAAGVSVVLAAMPAGATTAIFAEKYDADAAFASQCVVLTTVLSMALLPLWCIVLDFVF